MMPVALCLHCLPCRGPSQKLQSRWSVTDFNAT